MKISCHVLFFNVGRPAIIFWRASEYSIRHSVNSAVRLADEQQFSSLAFPIIGAGAGGFGVEGALQIMQDELQKIEANLQVTIVRYQKP